MRQEYQCNKAWGNLTASQAGAWKNYSLKYIIKRYGDNGRKDEVLYPGGRSVGLGRFCFRLRT